MVVEREGYSKFSQVFIFPKIQETKNQLKQFKENLLCTSKLSKEIEMTFEINKLLLFTFNETGRDGFTEISLRFFNMLGLKFTGTNDE